MIKIIVATTAFLISLISVAQVSENRIVPDFSKLHTLTGVEVLYTISNSKSVKVETDNLEKMNFIKTEVENGTLKIFVETNKNKNNSYISTKNKKRTINGVDFDLVKITVSGPNLSEIRASSSSKLKFVNTNKFDELEIKVSSSANITGSFEAINATIEASSSSAFLGNINAAKLDVKASSSANVDLTGKATKLTVAASSSADCKLKNLISEDATIKASSSADVIVNVTKSINAKASSSADITYYGNPDQIEKEESSSGSISKK